MSRTASVPPPAAPAVPRADFPGSRERGAGPLFGEGAIRLGRWFGIEIRLEASWFLVFGLLVFSLYGTLGGQHPALAPNLRWAVALGTSLLFFGSVLLHELAHSVMARRQGIQVRGITLMLFGGVSHLAGEPKRPKDDLAIALVGPLASAAIGGAFLAVAAAVAPFPVARTVATWLGFINLALAAFNLLPGFPLDGGRVLKAVIWAVTGNARRAYHWAIAAGRVVAAAMIFAGVVLAVGLHWTADGLWIGFLGWYLLSGAQASRMQLTVAEILKQHQVRDVLRPPEAVVRWDDLLSDVVDAWIHQRGHRTLLVCEEARLLGLVTLQEIRKVPRNEWDRQMVGQIMIPAGRLAIAVPEQNLFQAFQLMNERGVSQMPVVCQGDLLGLLTREDVVRILAIHTELTPLLPEKST